MAGWAGTPGGSVAKARSLYKKNWSTFLLKASLMLAPRTKKEDIFIRNGGRVDDATPAG